VVVNKDFITQVKERFKADDTILVMCRSGGRSAMAVNGLDKAGFTNVHNIIDGFEGNKVEDPESIYHGTRNGWKNSVPWTYRLDPKLVWLPSDAELETLRTTLEL
jgi:rhodanese-related sulfurtransferase